MTEDNSPEKEQRKQRFIEIFDHAAPTYDHSGPSFFAHFGEGLVTFAGVNEGDRVLDIATGRGAVLFPAGRAVGKGGHVTGTDLSGKMVDETSTEVKRLGMENVSIQLMDAENLRFTDGSFEVVLCGFAIFFFPRLETAMAEMRRVLKPGGCLAVTTWEKYEDERWKWFDELVDKYLPAEEEKVPPPGPQSQQTDFASTEGVRTILQNAGFIDISSLVERYEAIYPDEEAWWQSQWSHGGRALLEDIESKCGADGLERFRVEVFEGMKAVKAVDGIHTMWPAIFARGSKPKK